MPIEVRPAAGRFHTADEGRETWHSFSFGAHYDPHNVGFGALVALNDEHLAAGAGYPDHPHLDTEILTWVISGALHHRDSAGNSGVVHAGELQVLSAGSGVVHTEYAETGEPTRFVQSWIRPDESGLVPSYSAGAVAGTGLRRIATGDGGDGLRLHARGVSAHVGSLPAGARVRLPDAVRVHLFVGSGQVLLGERALGPADTARLLNEGGRELTAETDAEVFAWALP